MEEQLYWITLDFTDVGLPNKVAKCIQTVILKNTGNVS